MPVIQGVIGLTGLLIRGARRCPRHHGWYHWYLRLSGLSLDLRWPEAAVALIHGIHPTWSRAQCWFGRSRCWVSIPIPLSFELPIPAGLGLY